METTYKNIPLGGLFKTGPENEMYYKKTKIGKKVVALPMTGRFCYHQPTGCKNNLKVYQIEI